MIEAGEVIAVDRGDLDHLIKMQPGAAMDLLAASGQRLRESTFSVGNTVAPDEAYRRFRGRDADPNAIMRERGFPVG